MNPDDVMLKAAEKSIYGEPKTFSADELAALKPRGPQPPSVLPFVALQKRKGLCVEVGLKGRF